MRTISQDRWEFRRIGSPSRTPELLASCEKPSVSGRRPASCQVPGRFLREPAVVLRGQDLPGDGSARLHDQPADLAFDLGEYLRPLTLPGLARARQDLFGRRNCLARFLG